jgi:hypothetical protein
VGSRLFPLVKGAVEINLQLNFLTQNIEHRSGDTPMNGASD